MSATPSNRPSAVATLTLLLLVLAFLGGGAYGAYVWLVRPLIQKFAGVPSVKQEVAPSKPPVSTGKDNSEKPLIAASNVQNRKRPDQPGEKKASLDDPVKQNIPVVPQKPVSAPSGDTPIASNTSHPVATDGGQPPPVSPIKPAKPDGELTNSNGDSRKGSSSEPPVQANSVTTKPPVELSVNNPPVTNPLRNSSTNPGGQSSSPVTDEKPPVTAGTANSGSSTIPPTSDKALTEPSSNPPVSDNPPHPPAAEEVHEVATNSSEGAALINDALARIDEAPSDLYPERAKSKVRDGLKNARRIFKIQTVYFASGSTKPTSKDKTGFDTALRDSKLQDAMADPRAVFFVIGYADMTGSAELNKKISKDRADAVIHMLRKECQVENVTYPVAIGSTEIVAKENKDKNRAAEVWLVLP